MIFLYCTDKCWHDARQHQTVIRRWRSGSYGTM